MYFEEKDTVFEGGAIPEDINLLFQQDPGTFGFDLSTQSWFTIRTKAPDNQAF